MKSTVSPKPAEIERQWFVIDGAGVPVGRLSSTIAKLLMGKGKPFWAPHVDCGDFVIVLNAEKVHLSGTKEETKVYYRHTTHAARQPEVAQGLRSPRQASRRGSSRARCSACFPRPNSGARSARS